MFNWFVNTSLVLDRPTKFFLDYKFVVGSEQLKKKTKDTLLYDEFDT